MRWLIDNWSMIAVLASAIALAWIKIRAYNNAGAEEKARQREAMLDAVKAWALRGVTEAEKDLGDGTGKLKLRAVYERALEIFGSELASIISFEEFDDMIQAPLEEMRKMLETNKAAQAYVGSPDY